MRLIKSNNIEPEYPKRHICDECGAELEYDKEDAYIGWMGFECVTCPACDSEIAVSDQRVQPPTWKTTFHHTSIKTGAIDIKDNEVQKYVKKVTEHLCSNEYKPGEFYITGTGNLLVVGFKWENSVNIYVTKDYWGDSIATENYGMVK